jgi:hypothetical protein
MDVLIYSGQELFILDGDALLQFVLDDELLAFAKKGDPSLQLLHATWILEKTIEELLKKDCTFEIVFFESEFISVLFPLLIELTLLLSVLQVNLTPLSTLASQNTSPLPVVSPAPSSFAAPTSRTSRFTVSSLWRMISGRSGTSASGYVSPSVVFRPFVLILSSSSSPCTLSDTTEVYRAEPTSLRRLVS